MSSLIIGYDTMQNKNAHGHDRMKHACLSVIQPLLFLEAHKQITEK